MHSAHYRKQIAEAAQHCLQGYSQNVSYAAFTAGIIFRTGSEALFEPGRELKGGALTFTVLIP
jgi:hypothetical protein